MPRRAAGLSPKQKLFVAEYLVDLNATQAAIRAGYSFRRAAQSGYELLRKGPVAQAVAARQAELADRIGVTVERIVTELARIGFSDIRDVVQWRTVPAVSDAEDGGTNARAINVIEVKSADELTPQAAAAIAELSLRRAAPSASGCMTSGPLWSLSGSISACLEIAVRVPAA